VNLTLARAQQGDADAFRLLYVEHVGRIHALCLRMAGNVAEAEEFTQDVFVRAWQQLGSFRGESAFSTWLHRLAVNEVLQARRSTARRQARVMPTDTETMAQHAAPAAVAPMPELERAIQRLPDGAREVFVLYEIEGYQHQEIAAMTGIAEGTSKAQLHRARRLLRERVTR
jgi:RNA polymerase sigma-70 factor (ECF subfamily)